MNPKIYRGPWEWNAAEFCWTSPAGFVGLDLRPLQQQATTGGTPGIGIFVGSGTLSKDYDLLGTGTLRDVKSTQRMKDALPGKFRPRGDDLLGLILDILTEGADPDGIDGPKPLMPSSEGRLELFIPGQSPHYESFRWGDRYTSKVRDVIRRDFTQTMADAQAGKLRDAEHHRRVLDAFCDKFGVVDWKEFVPDRLQKDIPGRLRHETSISDDFNRSNGGLGTNWTAVSAGTVTGTLAIASNSVQSSSGSGATSSSYFNSSLSSADHYSQVSVTALNNGGGGGRNWVSGSARADSSGNQYNYQATKDSGGVARRRLLKFVSGTATSLNDSSGAISLADLFQIRVSGSTISGYLNGSSISSLTDTSITSPVAAGVAAFNGSGTAGDAKLDDFSAVDLAASGILLTQLEGFPRGVTRGMYTRWGG